MLAKRMMAVVLVLLGVVAMVSFAAEKEKGKVKTVGILGVQLGFMTIKFPNGARIKYADVPEDVTYEDAKKLEKELTRDLLLEPHQTLTIEPKGTLGVEIRDGSKDAAMFLAKGKLTFKRIDDVIAITPASD